MGTRSLIGFTHNGVTKASYNQYDGYPSYMGVQMLTFADTLAERYGNDKVSIINGLGADVDKLIVVKEYDSPTDAERVKLAEFSDDGVSTGADWYSTLRNCQGDPDAILRSGYILDSFNFGYDSLFCEWAYIIDLDTFTLDIYQGFRKTPTGLDGLWDDVKANGIDYIGVQKIASFSLDNLPDMELMTSLDSYE